MPRLYHRPPKYCLHKSTQQATVSLLGTRIYLGPYGSPESHQRYQEVLKQWQAERDQQQTPTAPQRASKVSSVTPTALREKRLAGSPLIVNELVLVYRRHTREYYRKNGRVTREATIIDDVIRYLRKHHATTFLHEFGPVALEELREGMITDLDWSRKHINKQVSRLIRIPVNIIRQTVTAELSTECARNTELKSGLRTDCDTRRRRKSGNNLDWKQHRLCVVTKRQT